AGPRARVPAPRQNTGAQTLHARVDVDGEDPHQVALDWMVAEGFVKEG
ncbi:glycine/betaine ABC transporter substrate-binding protein, partial [Streptomyces sp. NPDC057062]